MAARPTPDRPEDLDPRQPGHRGAERRRAGAGPTLVDTIKGSALPNLKELRPGSAGASEVRLLFVFDPQRQAVILVGGNEAGNWRNWYRTAVAQAETAYADHLARTAKQQGGVS